MQYQQMGSLRTSYERKLKYSDMERKTAIQHYLEHGKCIEYTICELGYPCKESLLNWIREACPEERRTLHRGGFHATFKKRRERASYHRFLFADNNSPGACYSIWSPKANPVQMEATALT